MNLSVNETVNLISVVNPEKDKYFNSLHLRKIMLWICVAKPSAKCGYIMCGAASFMFLVLLNSHINISSTNWNTQDFTCSQQYYWQFKSFGVKACAMLSSCWHLQECRVFTFRVNQTKQRGLLVTDDEGTAIPQTINKHLQFDMLQCPTRF